MPAVPVANAFGVNSGLSQASADSLGVGAYGGAIVNAWPHNSLQQHAVNRWAANALAANQLAANQAAANQLTANALAAAQAATNQLAANLWASNILARNQALANHLSSQQLAINQAVAQRLAQRQHNLNTIAATSATRQQASINPSISLTSPQIVAANSLASGAHSIPQINPVAATVGDATVATVAAPAAGVYPGYAAVRYPNAAFGVNSAVAADGLAVDGLALSAPSISQQQQQIIA